MLTVLFKPNVVKAHKNRMFSEREKRTVRCLLARTGRPSKTTNYSFWILELFVELFFSGVWLEETPWSVQESV